MQKMYKKLYLDIKSPNLLRYAFYTFFPSAIVADPRIRLVKGFYFISFSLPFWMYQSGLKKNDLRIFLFNFLTINLFLY